MIIYALVIISILFFLAWNLIDNRKLHWVSSLITTVLFLIATFFAVANFSDHYGMHRVNLPERSRPVHSLSPLSSLRLLAYQPMGTSHNSSVVIYKNAHYHVVHTAPDVKIHNRIVRSNVTQPHEVTRASKWEYRSSWTARWFKLAEKPSCYKVNHVFYVPKTWKLLTAKQLMAFRQIVKNRSLQLKRQMNTPQAKARMKQQASEFVKSQMISKMKKDPKLSAKAKQRVAAKAMKEFKAHVKQNAENKLATEALQTSETIH